jgi:hypothetical protein
MSFFLKKTQVLPTVLWTIFLLATNSIYGQTSFTKIFRPGPTEGIDAQVVKIVGCNPGNPNAESGNGNYANNPELNMSQWTYNGLGCGEGTIRSFIKFNQLNTIPAGAVIQSAKLSLFGLASSTTGPQGNSYYPGSPYNSYGENKCWIEKVSADWNENTLTFNNQPATTSINRAEIPASTAQFNSHALNIDVTQLVKDIISGQNYGFVIRQQIEQYYRNLGFSSSDATDSSRWPKLEVTYTTSAASPILNIGDISVPENSDLAQLAVCLSAPSVLPVTFNYKVSHGSASAGQDYVNINGTLTIPAGESCAQISVTIIDDNVKEATEDIVFVVENAVNATIGDAYGAINITDNDDIPPPSSPVVSINDVQVSETSRFGTLFVSIPSAQSVPVTVQYKVSGGVAVSGEDYINSSGTVTIAPGQTFAPIKMQLVNDSNIEPTEDVVINISNATNAIIGDAYGAINVLDDDGSGPLPIINIKPVIRSSDIGPGFGSQIHEYILAIEYFTSDLQPVKEDVRIPFYLEDGTAKAGADYYAARAKEITIPKGSNRASIGIFLNDDELVEGDEFFMIQFTNLVNAMLTQDSTRLVIIDNDFACLPGSACIANACPSRTVRIDSAYSIPNLPTGAAVTFHFGTPATNANKMSSAFVASGISNPGIYYAAVNIPASNCYSETIPVVVNIDSCFTSPNSLVVAALTNTSIYKKTFEEYKKLTIAPNPFINRIQAAIESSKDEKAVLTVLDIFGREIKSKTVQLSAGKNQVSVDGLGKLPAGNYLLRVANGNKVETYKMVKQE